MTHDQKRVVKKGRKRVIRVGAVNITTHPHSAEGYVRLLNVAKDMRRAIPIRGKHYGLIGSVRPLDSAEPLGPQYGEFHRYFNLDLDGDWYNTAEQKPAEVEELEGIVIPENLKPEFESFRFLFFPHVHRLFFESKAHRVGTLSPNQVKEILDGLFSVSAVVEKFGKVDVVVEPTAEQLERIFSMAKLRKLHIEVSRPNADDLSKTEREVFDRLDAEDAEKVVETVVAQEHKSIKPTEHTKNMCKVAASNGKVTGSGLDANNRSVTESTTDHPWVEAEEYYPNIQPESEAFIEKAKKMLGVFLRRRLN